MVGTAKRLSTAKSLPTFLLALGDSARACKDYCRAPFEKTPSCRKALEHPPFFPPPPSPSFSVAGGARSHRTRARLKWCVVLWWKAFEVLITSITLGAFIKTDWSSHQYRNDAYIYGHRCSTRTENIEMILIFPSREILLGPRIKFPSQKN